MTLLSAEITDDKYRIIIMGRETEFVKDIEIGSLSTPILLLLSNLGETLLVKR
jgi:hypothetical protein